MIENIQISNFKSIIKTNLELGNINVFIGENGCGKTNILEAIAMLSASKDYNLNINGLSSRGVRVTKPSLTISSFVGQRKKAEIEISAKFSYLNKPIQCLIYPENVDDIYSEWEDKNSNKLINKVDDTLDDFVDEQLEVGDFEKIFEEEFKKIIEGKDTEIKNLTHSVNLNFAEIKKRMHSELKEKVRQRFLEENFEKNTFLTKYLIFNLNTQSLRGILSNSKEIPLGINGEGLDLLLHDFSKEEWEELRQYNYLIDWLDDIIVDDADALKYKGHKLGRSSSFLYFKDKYMRKNNNIFAAENSNEGVLNILFYLALLISKKTPKFFAIDNIETSLNPKLCRTLMSILTELSIRKKKQILITTHNPAILDGLNLFDDNQRLFVVKRTDEGNTKVERIRLKPQVKGKELKLSEMWMRGYLGGLPNNF